MMGEGRRVRDEFHHRDGDGPDRERTQRKAIERTNKTKRQIPVCFRFFLHAYFLFSV